MKTLYLSDLDGTLLRSDQRTSAYTNGIVNALAERGVHISYATARSIHTACRVTEGICVSLPVIVHNGAYVLDSLTRRPLYTVRFSPEEEQTVFSSFRARGLFPITYSVLGGRDRFSYLWEACSDAQREFIRSRLGDGRERRILCEEEALAGELFYFACIEEAARLRPVYEELSESFRCFFSKDIYTGEQWLEVLPRGASKASAALVLKEMLGCEKLVCFGDGVNDIPLFEIADECYAVANAHPALKGMATGVISSNDEDGVARWLEKFA